MDTRQIRETDKWIKLLMPPKFVWYKDPLLKGK